MALIPLTGLPSSFRVPGAYGELLFAQGPSSAGSPRRDVVLAMPMLSSGSWTAGKLYGPIKNAQQAEDGAGAGSPLHRAMRMFFMVNRDVDVYALPVAETAGGAPAKADATVTWATDPTGTGLTTIWVAGEELTVSFDSNDTVTTIAAAMKDLVNARTHLPITATNVAGVLTLEAKLNGISQGDGTTGAIRLRGQIDSGVGTTITVEAAALGLGTGTAGAEGSTAEAANLATALTAIDANRIYYIVTSAWDATSLSNLVTHVTTKSEPKRGLRSVIIGAFTGTLAAAQTLATARNYERLQIAWQKNSEHDPAELAAIVAGIRSKHENTYSAYNFGGYRESDWLVKAAADEADWPTVDDQNDALNDGVAPIASDRSGSYLVHSVNTRSKTNSVDDFRATKTGKVSVGDDLLDTLMVRHALNMKNKKLRDDQRLADGSVDPNQRFGPRVITPSKYKATIRKVARDFEDADKINDAQLVIDSCNPVIDPANKARLEMAIDYEWLEDFDQATFRVAETSAG